MLTAFGVNVQLAIGARREGDVGAVLVLEAVLAVEVVLAAGVVLMLEGVLALEVILAVQMNKLLVEAEEAEFHTAALALGVIESGKGRQL